MSNLYNLTCIRKVLIIGWIFQYILIPLPIDQKAPLFLSQTNFWHGSYHAQAAILTVTHDLDVSNTYPNYSGSIREAIEIANTNAEADTIYFDPSVTTIYLTQELTLTEGNLSIIGTQSGSDLPQVNLTPSINHSITQAIRVITNGNNTVQGLAIYKFDQYGILLFTTNNTVQGCYLGTDTQMNSGLGNGVSGILISNHQNWIGGDITKTAERNIIVGNSHSGLYINADNNQIFGNYIGIDSTNSINANQRGIFIGQTADQNLIGASTNNYSNIIAKNTSYGIELLGNQNMISSNYIGLSLDPVLTLGNGNSGIYIDDGVSGGNGNIVTQNIISNNNQQGIYLDKASNTTIEKNKIGTDASAQFSMGNGQNGIYISNNASNTTIGGTTTIQRNIISGNTQNGIYNLSTSITIENNYIGTTLDGTSTLSNQNYGLILSGLNNYIAHNLISGNSGYGIHLIGDYMTITQNWIGVDSSGTQALANGYIKSGFWYRGGISTQAGADHNTISYNVISGNKARGISLSSDFNTISNNYIGVGSDGITPVGNGEDGIFIFEGSNQNIIGGTSSAYGNVIGANGQHGIFLVGDQNTISNNWIGTNSINTNLGNQGYGVNMSDYVWFTSTYFPDLNQITQNNFSNNLIGIFGSGQGQNNFWSQNLFSNHLNLAIDISETSMPNGITLNDFDDTDTFFNSTLNYPTITRAILDLTTSTLNVSGTLNISEMETTATVEIYQVDISHTSSYGEGSKYLGSIQPTNTTQGSWNISISPVSLTSSDLLTSLCTSPSLNASEFSQNIMILIDSDGDTIDDLSDNCLTISNINQADNDEDSMGDACDDDDDNDGYLDILDDFPFDASEFQDTDSDQIGNNQDPDDDNDGFSDIIENLLQVNSLDSNQSPIVINHIYHDLNSEMIPMIQNSEHPLKGIFQIFQSDGSLYYQSPSLIQLDSLETIPILLNTNSSNYGMIRWLTNSNNKDYILSLDNEYFSPDLANQVYGSWTQSNGYFLLGLSNPNNQTISINISWFQKNGTLISSQTLQLPENSTQFIQQQLEVKSGSIKIQTESSQLQFIALLKTQNKKNQYFKIPLSNLLLQINSDEEKSNTLKTKYFPFFLIKPFKKGSISLSIKNHRAENQKVKIKFLNKHHQLKMIRKNITALSQIQLKIKNSHKLNLIKLNYKGSIQDIQASLYLNSRLSTSPQMLPFIAENYSDLHQQSIYGIMDQTELANNQSWLGLFNNQSNASNANLSIYADNELIYKKSMSLKPYQTEILKIHSVINKNKIYTFKIDGPSMNKIWVGLWNHQSFKIYSTRNSKYEY